MILHHCRLSWNLKLSYLKKMHKKWLICNKGFIFWNYNKTVIEVGVIFFFVHPPVVRTFLYFIKFLPLGNKDSKLPFLTVSITYISQELNYNFATTCFMSRCLDNHQATKLITYTLSMAPLFWTGFTEKQALKLDTPTYTLHFSLKDSIWKSSLFFSDHQEIKAPNGDRVHHLKMKLICDDVIHNGLKKFLKEHSCFHKNAFHETNCVQKYIDENTPYIISIQCVVRRHMLEFALME